MAGKTVENNKISFVELDKRLNQVPDGPAAVLDTPSWLLGWNVFGCLGLVLGLLPSLLIRWLEPAYWMVDMARSGVWISSIAFAPGFIRSIWVIARSMWRWRPEQAEQLDHDFSQFSLVSQELATAPLPQLAERLRFAELVQLRLTMKLGLIGGSLEKLGVLPAIVAIAFQLKAYSDPLAIPLWQVIVGLFLAITYLIAMIGSLMRIRLQLYAMVLQEAIARKE